jgi:hypothetical protein
MSLWERERDAWKAAFGVEPGDIDTTPEQKAAELAELRARLARLDSPAPRD